MIIKERVGNRYIIRNNHYGHSLQFFLELFNEAKKDFPDLTPSRVDVVQYAGQRYKRTFGIEFLHPDNSDLYMPIERVELTF